MLTEIKHPLYIGRLIHVKYKSREEVNLLQESINRNVCQPKFNKDPKVNKSNKHTFVDRMNSSTQSVLARPGVGMIITEDMSCETPKVTSI